MKVAISKPSLENILQGVQGCQPVSIDIVTDPRMTKTNNPYLGTMKHNTINGLIGFNYTNSVNNQLAREGQEKDFEAQPRKWGERKGKLVYHTTKDGENKIYIEVKVQSSGEPVFMFNDTEISKSLIEHYLPKHKKPATQDGIDKEVVVRDVSFDSIRAIRVDGTEYEIAENIVESEKEMTTEKTPVEA